MAYRFTLWISDLLHPHAGGGIYAVCRECGTRAALVENGGAAAGFITQLALHVCPRPGDEHYDDDVAETEVAGAGVGHGAGAGPGSTPVP